MTKGTRRLPPVQSARRLTSAGEFDDDSPSSPSDFVRRSSPPPPPSYCFFGRWRLLSPFAFLSALSLSPLLLLLCRSLSPPSLLLLLSPFLSNCSRNMLKRPDSFSRSNSPFSRAMSSVCSRARRTPLSFSLSSSESSSHLFFIISNSATEGRVQQYNSTKWLLC